MNDFLSNSIGGEIMIVYGLIGLVLILIVTILFLDKREKRKKKDLFNNKFINTVKMKPIQDVIEKPAKEIELQPIGQIEPKEEMIQTETILAPIGTPEWVTAEIPVINDQLLEMTEEVTIMEDGALEIGVLETPTQEDKSMVSEEKKEILISETEIEKVSVLEESIEEDLGKTQAQLQLEELQVALSKATEEQIIKQTSFELIQEEEAIISYKELVQVCDRLYDENEKVQYIDEGNEPINLEELQKKFQKTITQPVEETSYESQTKIEEVLEEKTLLVDENPVLEEGSRFRSTPFISPVYGIQREEEPFYRAIPSSEKELPATDY